MHRSVISAAPEWTRCYLHVLHALVKTVAQTNAHGKISKKCQSSDNHLYICHQALIVSPKLGEKGLYRVKLETVILVLKTKGCLL